MHVCVCVCVWGGGYSMVKVMTLFNLCLQFFSSPEPKAHR